MFDRRSIVTGGLAATGTLLMVAPTAIAAQTAYPQTIDTLQRSRGAELESYRRYLAFSKKANADRYPGIAYLFFALATAEFIHKQNFEKVLARLGIEIAPLAESQIIVESTQKNLITAASKELSDVKVFYPKMLNDLKPEGFQDAITMTTWAWETEKEHLDILNPILKWTPDYFAQVATKIEKSTGQYFVCQICGSTAVKIPPERCPICKFPSENYRKIEAPTH
ncbi:MAG TPA: ferritin family protein [Caulobacteraceae bacterium]|nr:ferritin family protein [Caulobacteraceae bacterium]